MSASQRILCALSQSLPCALPSTLPSSLTCKSRTFLFLCFSHSYRTLARSSCFTSSFVISPSAMPRNQRSVGYKEQRWKEKPKTDGPLSATRGAPDAAAECVGNRLAGMRIAENSGQANVPAATIMVGGVQPANQGALHSQKTIWKPKSYGTASGTTAADNENNPVSKLTVSGPEVVAETASAPKTRAGLSKLFGGNLLEKFTVDNSTYSLAQIRYTFYPKFENEKSDQEVRTRMIEMVSKGLATLEVSLKHSGSLFMYAGHEGGAYAKNSFGNIYSTVGVCVLGRMFREAWGTEAAKKQAEFNEFLEKVADERRKKPNSIMLADKNAPNEEVWRQIEEMCHRTRASAVPVVPKSEGTDSNPFSLDALAVFMFRVLQRVNHPGNLDKASPNAGYVLLMFYHLYEGKSRKEFEGELIDRFGSIVKMPLLKSDRVYQGILRQGMDQLGETITRGSLWKCEYLHSIQVPFEFAVEQVLEQLRNIAKGDYTPPETEKRKFGTIVFAALSLPVKEIQGVLNNLAENNPKIEAFLKDKHLENLNRAHVTLAHKISHGIKAVADYDLFLHKMVPVDLTALLFSDKMAAFEACLGSVEGERIVSKNEWPHVTSLTGEGVTAKEASMLPQLLAEGKASRIDFSPPITISGTVEFY